MTQMRSLGVWDKSTHYVSSIHRTQWKNRSKRTLHVWAQMIVVLMWTVFWHYTHVRKCNMATTYQTVTHQALFASTSTCTQYDLDQPKKMLLSSAFIYKLPSMNVVYFLLRNIKGPVLLNEFQFLTILQNYNTCISCAICSFNYILPSVNVVSFSYGIFKGPVLLNEFL